VVIDFHGHLGTAYKMYPLRHRTPEAMIAEMDRCGIDKLVISSFESILYYPASGNDVVREACQRYPGRLIPLFCVHPRYGDEALREIDRCAGEWGWRGMKLHPESHQYRADGPQVMRIVERAARHGCFVKFHSGDAMVGTYCPPRSIGAVAARFPGTTFIMAHMGVTDWQEGIEVAIEHPNIILDTTGCVIDMGMIEYAVEAIGHQRLVWGSDFSMYPFELGLSKLMDSHLTPEQKDAILGANALRLLGLVLRSEEARHFAE